MPLSNEAVISRLNARFIPVYLANEDYRGGGSAPPEERAELARIHREGHAKKLSVGTVHAYALAPDGTVLDSLHVADAFKVEKLLAMLDRASEGVRPGAPVVAPSPPARPKAPEGGLLLHVTARYLERQGTEYRLVVDAGGNWSAFPGEAYVPLDRAALRRMLPSERARTGLVWQVPKADAEALLTHFYPPTENNDLSKNTIELAELEGQVTEVKDGRVRALLSGRLRMGHPFYHKPDGKVVTATIAGAMEWDAGGRVHTLQLVTDTAEYGPPNGPGLPFGAVLRAVP